MAGKSSAKKAKAAMKHTVLLITIQAFATVLCPFEGDSLRVGLIYQHRINAMMQNKI
jgi:hypothetical protein